MAEARPPQRRGRLLKVAGIVTATVIGVAALALIGVNAYVRVAYAPFYEAATDEFPLPGLDAGFVPQDLRPMPGCSAATKPRTAPRRSTAATPTAPWRG